MSVKLFIPSKRQRLKAQEPGPGEEEVTLQARDRCNWLLRREYHSTLRRACAKLRPALQTFLRKAAADVSPSNNAIDCSSPMVGAERMVPAALVDVASMAADRAKVAEHLTRYIKSDLLCACVVRVESERSNDVNALIKDIVYQATGCMPRADRGCSLALEALEAWWQEQHTRVISSTMKKNAPVVAIVIDNLEALDKAVLSDLIATLSAFAGRVSAKRKVRPTSLSLSKIGRLKREISAKSRNAECEILPVAPPIAIALVLLYSAVVGFPSNLKTGSLALLRITKVRFRSSNWCLDELLSGLFVKMRLPLRVEPAALAYLVGLFRRSHRSLHTLQHQLAQLLHAHFLRPGSHVCMALFPACRADVVMSIDEGGETTDVVREWCGSDGGGADDDDDNDDGMRTIENGTDQRLSQRTVATVIAHACERWLRAALCAFLSSVYGCTHHERSLAYDAAGEEEEEEEEEEEGVEADCNMDGGNLNSPTLSTLLIEVLDTRRKQVNMRRSTSSESVAMSSISSDLKIAEKESYIGEPLVDRVQDALSILGNVTELRPLCTVLWEFAEIMGCHERPHSTKTQGTGTGHYGNEAVHWIASGITHYGNPHGSTSHRRMCCRFTAASSKIEEIAALARAAYLTFGDEERQTGAQKPLEQDANGLRSGSERATLDDVVCGLRQDAQMLLQSLYAAVTSIDAGGSDAASGCLIGDASTRSVRGDSGSNSNSRGNGEGEGDNGKSCGSSDVSSKIISKLPGDERCTAWSMLAFPVRRDQEYGVCCSEDGLLMNPKDVHLSSSLRSGRALVRHLEELFDPVPRAAVRSALKDPHGSYLNQCRCAQHIKGQLQHKQHCIDSRCAAYQTMADGAMHADDWFHEFVTATINQHTSSDNDGDNDDEDDKSVDDTGLNKASSSKCSSSISSRSYTSEESAIGFTSRFLTAVRDLEYVGIVQRTKRDGQRQRFERLLL